jgi:hypothetical protein
LKYLPDFPWWNNLGKTVDNFFKNTEKTLECIEKQGISYSEVFTGSGGKHCIRFLKSCG